jgi:hypothetical protein
VFLQSALAAEKHLAESDLEITMNRKSGVVPYSLEGLGKPAESRMEGQAMFHFKSLIRKRAL